MQPLVWDKKRVVRFKGNQIVRDLLDAAGEGRKRDLNDIVIHGYSPEDRDQFWQLIGYSVSGYGELSFIRRKTVATADRLADEMAKSRKRRERTPGRSAR